SSVVAVACAARDTSAGSSDSKSRSKVSEGRNTGREKSLVIALQATRPIRTRTLPLHMQRLYAGIISNDERSPEVPVPTPGTACTDVEVLEPRAVPLGGPRAMPVSRTLPQKKRSLVGSWCFIDHYGPDDVSLTGGMDVARHPHTGLATVSWLFSGEIDHLDS